MVAPGPDAAQLDQIIAAATRVPDHGKLNPWRLIIIPAERRADFAALLTSAYRAERPQAGRFRQFWQIGSEHFGPSDAAADADTVLMTMFIGDEKEPTFSVTYKRKK